jgi:hypothetical protein
MAQPMRLSILIGADASGAKTGGAEAEKAIQKVGQAANQAGTAVKGLIEAQTGLGRAMQSTDMRGADIAAYGAQLDALRARYNPLYATINRYKTEVQAIRQAHAVGAISINEMTTALSRERQAALASIDAIKGRNAAIAQMRSGSTSFATSNIAYQFQDIGVTAAMGMSPLQIGLQQGTQIAAAVSEFGTGRAAIAGVGAALGSLISPLSLATIGLTVAAAAAIQYGSSLFSATEDSEDALKAQADLIQEVASRWGDALPALAQYAEQVKRLENEQNAQQALQAAIRQQWADLRAEVNDTNTDFADLITTLSQSGVKIGLLQNAQKEFGEFKDAVVAGTATSKDLEEAQTSLMAIFEKTGIPIVKEFSDTIGELSTKLMDAAKNTADLKKEQIDLLNRGRNGSRGPLINDPDFLKRNWEVMPDAPVPQTRPTNPGAGFAPIDTEVLDPLAAERKRAADELERQRQATADYLQTQRDGIARLQLEISLVGKSAEERAKATAAFEAEIRIRELGISAMSREADAIRANAAATADLRLELERQQAAWGSIQSAGGQAIDQLFKGSGTLKDRLKSLADTALDWLIEMTLVNPAKNGLLGMNLPTLADVGKIGKGGQAGALSPTSTGSMMVTAGTVMINGGVTGGIPGLTGGANTTLGSFLGLGAANTNSVRPTLTPSGMVNSPVAAASPVARGGIEAQIWNYWAGKGLQPHQIAGIMGNLRAESAFNPAAIGDSGNALGLAQWNDRGPAMTAAVPDWRTNVQGQLDFMSREFATSENASWNKLLASTNVTDATAAMAGYERPRGYSPGNPMGADNWSGRLDAANASLAKFGQTTATASTDVQGLGKTSVDAGQSLMDAFKTPAAQQGQASGLGLFPSAPATGAAGVTATGAPGIFGMFSQLFSGGGNLFSSLFSSIFSLFGFSRGGVFAGGGVIPFANGGVVTRPTLFPMAGGRTGLMGEAGEEAIIPLRRGRDGRLGVTMAMPKAMRQDGGRMNFSFSSNHRVEIYGNGDAELHAQWKAGTEQMLEQQARDFRASLPDLIEEYQQNPYRRVYG